MCVCVLNVSLCESLVNDRQTYPYSQIQFLQTTSEMYTSQAVSKLYISGSALNNDAFNYQYLPALAQDHSEQLDDSTERVT